jgi:hypothetical protein
MGNKFVEELFETTLALCKRYGSDETKWPPVLQEKGDNYKTFDEVLDKSEQLQNYTEIKTQKDVEKAASMSFSNNANLFYKKHGLR